MPEESSTPRLVAVEAVADPDHGPREVEDDDPEPLEAFDGNTDDLRNESLLETPLGHSPEGAGPNETAFPDRSLALPGPVSDPASFPNLRQSIGLLLLFLLVATALSLGAGILLHEDDRRMGYAEALLGLITFGLVIVVGWKRTRQPWRVVFPLTKIRPRLWPFLAMSLVGFLVVEIQILHWISPFLPGGTWIEEYFERLWTQLGNTWARLFSFVILPAFAEEFLFRGLILRGLLKSHRPAVAVAISALLFGAFHLNLQQLFGATMLGLIFGWWYVRTRSLLPSILGHAFINSVPVTLMEIPNPELRRWLEDSHEVPSLPWWLVGSGLILFLVGTLTLRRLWVDSSKAAAADSRPPAIESAEGPPVVESAGGASAVESAGGPSQPGAVETLQDEPAGSSPLHSPTQEAATDPSGIDSSGRSSTHPNDLEEAKPNPDPR